eukprot:CAMPEP_0172670614 /NCGR_PEP_ID=MMETSP1074-20121228/10405_1 /TAXON_ID=2916 /ORGANISM="Ceratium fusus, Strain PA161109" /LENGTH=470 /DNA_ID=CAMNT_0013487547 /DNA_START=42 /DNA_END=1454 /DNA_ORIENTATION=+
MDRVIPWIQERHKDIRSALQQDGVQPHKKGNGRLTHRPGRARGAAQATAAATPFPDAWKIYCATNSRLRHPTALPAMVRRGVPDELRVDVWAHCLGIAVGGHSDTSCASGSTTPSEKDERVRSQAPADRANNIQEADESPQNRNNLPEIVPEAPESVIKDNQGVPGSISDDDECRTEASESLLEEKLLRAQSLPSSTEDWHDARLAVPVLLTDDAALPHGVAELIEADVQRTFPSCPDFQKAGGSDQLRRVLRSLAASDTELGYCQSLNFIAAIFIMVLRNESAALLSVQQLLVKLGTRTWYTDGMRQLRADTCVLEDLLQERLPAVHRTMRACRFDLLFVTSKWFLCLFATTLEGETLRRVWDILLCDGIEVVFRIAFALLAQRSEAIVRAKSMDDLIHMFQETLPETSPDQLIQSAYNPSLIGAINRSELASRRRSKVKAVSSGDTRAEMRNRHLWRGGVRPASVLAR